ncbi:alpha/beta fold hydrolase [Bdellovibrio sp. HCB290]|uniref:alpha/beta fold hydrolase n=1 Tax=Bdellovibrio sp. HCB290 TaxID=3394356 RepID=UPI0039B467CD
MSKSIVCLPGFLCDDRLWKYQREILTSQECKFLDLRHSENLNQMLDQIDQAFTGPLTLIGFSMGAYVAQVFATRFPHRVEELILIGSTGSPFSDSEFKARVQTANTLKKVAFGGLSPKALQHYIHQDALNNEEIRNQILEMAAGNNTEMYLNQMNATLHRMDLKMSLNAMQFPITLIGGAQDQIAPKDKVEAFQRAIPRSTLHMIEGSGHFIPLEKPTELNAILMNALSKN